MDWNECAEQIAQLPGITKINISLMATPVQMEGELVGGQALYYRSRWSSTTLGIAPEFYDAVGGVMGEGGAWASDLAPGEIWPELDGEYGAGCLSPEQALETFRILYGEYLALVIT